MQNLTVLLCCLLCSLSTFAADKVIQLSKPNMQRQGSVMKALADRQSTREYSTKALSNQDLSDLLWAANGINRPQTGKRTAPSAMNKQDVDVYVVMPQGIYLYNAKAHQLDIVAEGDYRAAVAGQQAWVKDAPVSLVLVSDLSRFGASGKPHFATMGAVDVGIVSQNISLFCASAGLATVPRGSMDAEKLGKALKLTDSQLLVLNQPVGYFK